MELLPQDHQNSDLHQKIVDAVKNYMSETVTLIEGFVSVQTNGNNFRHIHISYREIPNGGDNDAAFASETTPPYLPAANCDSPSTRKVNRRKAYMPIKCDGSNEPEEASECGSNRRRLLYYQDKKVSRRTPCHFQEKEDAEKEEALLTQKEVDLEESFDHNQLTNHFEPSHFQVPTEVDPQIEHELQDANLIGRKDPSTVLPLNCMTVDSDPIGPLNAETIQASMKQVMQPPLSLFPLASFNSETQLSPLAFNAVIPLPSLVPDPSLSVKPKPKILPEQRKIKPKPLLIDSQGISRTNNISPYARPHLGFSKRNPNKEFSCNQCQLKFKSLHSLTEHTTTVHICFRCTTCNSKFTQRSNLQRHSLKHLGFKPFRCGICMKEYYRKDHLVRHVEVSHPGSEPKATIVNVLPSAECLRILEETQKDVRRQKMAPNTNGEVTQSSTPQTDDNGPYPSNSDLQVSDSSVRVVEKDDIFDLDVDSSFVNSTVDIHNLVDDDELDDDDMDEEDGEDIEKEEEDDVEEEDVEEDEYDLESYNVILPRHLVPFSGSDCPVSSDVIT